MKINTRAMTQTPHYEMITMFMYVCLMCLCDCSEALPFFLLLVDLSKACTLAKYALSSLSQVLSTHHSLLIIDCWL